MKQKILMLTLAICMATVARPQTLTSNVTLVSQKTEKVFGFKNKMVVIKTRTTKTFAYQRVDTVAVDELVASGDADYGPLYDVRVNENIEASFPIKNMGLMSHYDTSDYAKAFANPGEEVFAKESDTMNILRHYFFFKDSVIQKYSIVFDENGFTLATIEITKTEPMHTEMLTILLSPSFVLIFGLGCFLLFAWKDKYVATFYKRTSFLNKYWICFASSFFINIIFGFAFLAVFNVDNHDVLVLIPVWVRVLLVIARLCVTFVITLILSNAIKRFALRGIDLTLVQG